METVVILINIWGEILIVGGAINFVSNYNRWRGHFVISDGKVLQFENLETRDLYNSKFPNLYVSKFENLEILNFENSLIRPHF